MEHLESKQIVHRDLAARNVLGMFYGVIYSQCHTVICILVGQCALINIVCCGFLSSEPVMNNLDQTR